jgi:endonuclease YncB( thermonuclease family)
MSIFILAAAAVATCPTSVGQSNRTLVEVYQSLMKAYPSSHPEARKLRRDIQGEKVKEGYALLDAGCRRQAEVVFRSVWDANGDDTWEFANQAREALNRMR